MATITTILATDIIASSRVTLNTNFTNLNTDKVDVNSTYADPAWITSLAATKLTGVLPNANTTATATNTASAIVARDASGNFAAGTITASQLSVANGAATEVSFTGSGQGTNISTDSGFLFNIDTASAIPGAATFEVSKGSSYTRLLTVHDFGVVQLGQDADTPIDQELKSHDALTTGVGSALLIKSGESAGLNQGGGVLRLRGGQRTGNSATGGNIVFQGFTSVASGSSLQTVADRMTMYANGNLMIGYGSDNGNKLAVDGTALAVTFVNADGDVRVRSGAVDFGSAAIAAWSSTSAYTGAKDFAIARNAAGVGEINNGTSGTFRDLRVRDLFQNGTANKAVFGGEAVASGQVLYGTAAGVAGSEAAFVYNAATNALTIGAARIGDTVHYSGYAAWGHDSQNTLGGLALIQGSAGDTYLNSASGAALVFRTGGVESFRVAPTTRNLLLNTTTDDTVNRLQVAGSVAGTVTSAVSNQDGATSLRLATSLTGTAVPGTVGARLTFAQRWSNGDLGVIRVGAINGWKTAADGAFGGGIQLLHQPNASADMAVTLSTFQSGNVAIGTTTDDGVNRLQVAGSVAVTTNIAATRTILSSASAAPQIRLNVTGQSGYWEIYSDFNNTNADLWFRPNGTGTTSSFTQVNNSGNWAFGTTAANTFKIDIAASGSSGTLRAYDQTPTTGVTQLIVRAGAGQSTTNLQTWQNAAGSGRLLVTSSLGLVALGTFYSVQDSAGTINRAIIQSTMDVNSSYSFNFSSTTDAVGTKDLSLSRAGVNIGQFGDGGSNSNGLLYLKGVRPVGSTVANLPTAAGNTGMLATVTDANATTIGTTVAGGGADTVLVWSNGTNWRIYAN